ncbi:hypothetical protein IHE45_07G024900 [Dioscorea alata]|uniref:Uncharacterized protein n=1 Tax=Dioscorea alata TaxID=55571 RepID=A0ACB7VPN2_DIOAL|nr:hypothetical protein IHE45_07G024900 [Dioscorea alata]
MILNCSTNCLPLIYLGVPLSGRKPRRSNWSTLIGIVRSRLSPWKSTYLSLGGRLTLLNSVLSTVPVYWISVFKLPIWVLNKIYKIRRDFLWKGPELGPKGIRPVAWNRICRPRKLGGIGILNLQEFNKALLGKWWWKLITNPNSYFAKISKFNYLKRNPIRFLYQPPPRNKSYFWVGIH